MVTRQDVVQEIIDLESQRVDFKTMRVVELLPQAVWLINVLKEVVRIFDKNEHAEMSEIYDRSKAEIEKMDTLT